MKVTANTNKKAFFKLIKPRYNMTITLCLPQIPEGTQPRVQEKGLTEKFSERSCETAMYAFSGSLLYQPDGDEKLFSSSCSGNGSRTAHCDTARKDNN
ncbi:unnamed protein product [Clavelina lepadiformis]|uniref:Uncharacterized protein n=1 Tax=Clavelina lepadiformis TaxID=159417 RepID=A0ABP0FA50_CLALP